MRAATNGQKCLISALLILSVLCAPVHADGGAIASLHDEREPVDRTRDEQFPKQTCATFYRLDDVTELNDEIRRCLITSEGGTARS